MFLKNAGLFVWADFLRHRQRQEQQQGRSDFVWSVHIHLPVSSTVFLLPLRREQVALPSRGQLQSQSIPAVWASTLRACDCMNWLESFSASFCRTRRTLLSARTGSSRRIAWARKPGL